MLKEHDRVRIIRPPDSYYDNKALKGVLWSKLGWIGTVIDPMCMNTQAEMQTQVQLDLGDKPELYYEGELEKISKTLVIGTPKAELEYLMAEKFRVEVGNMEFEKTLGLYFEDIAAVEARIEELEKKVMGL